jgi:mono/diheme cytochrome c family protein
MKIKHLGFAAGVAAGLIGWSGAALADGKATFEGICAECHEAADFEGEPAADLQETISQIVKGELKHKKKLTLSDAEVAEIASFLAAGGK